MEFINLGQAGAPLELAAARLAGYHFSAGKRIQIFCADSGLAERLDRALWDFEQGSFVPHALAGAEDQAVEPVLITPGPANLNQATVLIMAEPIEPAPLADYELIIDFVPAEAGPALDGARERFRAMQSTPDIDLAHITDLP